MAYNYFLLFKTAQAEFRAWHELPSTIIQNIFPIVELTRGRKTPKAIKDAKGNKIDETLWPKTPGVYGFEGVMEKVRDSFKSCDNFIMDVTREDGLSCAELDDLSRSQHAYNNWTTFLEVEKQNLGGLIPTIIINPSEGENELTYKTNLAGQFTKLAAIFPAIAYRASVLLDSEFIYDLLLLKDLVNQYIENGKKFIIELDHEFIRPGTGMLHALRTIGVIERISEILPRAQIVILATSFPKTVDELGDPDHDSFPLEEVYLYEEIIKNADNANLIHYGDYGSINPQRNDQSFSRGWRPRIDFPTSKKKTFYYREKREKDDNEVMSTYDSHYVSVAKKVTKDRLFEKIPNSWGVKQIEQAAGGSPPGKSPSFWISVRMEIHLRQQIKRIGLSN